MSFKTFVIPFALFFIITSVSATQIIVVNETKEKVYALEDVLISGDLATNLLKITSSGEVIQGEGVKVYLFGPASDLLVKDLKVNGRPTSVSFDSDGYFFVAEVGDFTLNGKLEIRTIGQIRLYVAGPMNSLRFQIKNGYAINGDQFGLFEKEIVIQRSDKVAMVIDGNFRFTYAQRNEFLYQINFKAFGSSLGAYTIPLKNNEVVSTVTGVMKWEQKGKNLVLDLSSDTASVTIRGYFSSTQLKIPLAKDKHNVLVESDPEKKITISTTAKEIDLKDSSLTSQYSNARAFLASPTDVFYITIKNLGTYPSLAASVRSATNRIAITSKGSILGELVYSYANTGVDYIEIDVEGTPLYASTNRQAVKLTKEDKLLLSFPKSQSGTLDFVYFTTRGKLKPIDLINIPLAKTDIPITTARTTIYLPTEYIVLETFGVKGGSELPTAKTALLYIILIGGLSALLIRERKFVTNYLIFSVGLLVFDSRMFMLLIAVTIILIAKRYIAGKQLKTGLALVAIVIAVIIAVIVGLVLIWQVGVFSTGGAMMSKTVEYRADAMMGEELSAVPKFKGLEAIGEGTGAITVPVRKGVYPVKFELPNLGKTITVTNHLVTKENQINLKVLVLAAWFKYILYAIAAWAGLICYRNYKK